MLPTTRPPRGVLLLPAVAALLAACWLPRSAAVNPLVSWLTLAQASVQATGVEHQPAARVYAVVAAAQHDAILAARAYTGAEITDDVAAAYAGHSALSTLFTWRQSTFYDPALRAQLASLNVGTNLLPHLSKLIVPIVNTIVYRRVRDRSNVYSAFTPFSNSSENIGKYQFTPGQTTTRWPQVASATGFYLSNGDINTLTAPYKKFKLGDTEYANQLLQVYWVGSASSTNRSSYDSGSPRFWALGAGTSTVAGIWLNISITAMPESTPLILQARFFKLLTTSLWDAAIAVWRVKFRELFWRPVTALRAPHTTALGPSPYDPSWTPLLPTPGHPEYPSGHQTTSGVAVYVLEAYFGTSFTFEAVSGGTPDISPRSYTSFRAAGLECGDSRLYGGVHFNKSNMDGFNLGIAVAKRIHARYFQGTAPLTN